MPNWAKNCLITCEIQFIYFVCTLSIKHPCYFLGRTFYVHSIHKLSPPLFSKIFCEHKLIPVEIHSTTQVWSYTRTPYSICKSYSMERRFKRCEKLGCYTFFLYGADLFLYYKPYLGLLKRWICISDDTTVGLFGCESVHIRSSELHRL